MSTNVKHLPVMVDEVISYLRPKHNKIYFDGTFGQGGYSKQILKFNSKVIAIDRDILSKKYAKKLILEYPKNFFFKNEKFSNIQKILKGLKIKKINGLMLDLGLSSTQIECSSRGFSFNLNGPLDMRMNNQSKEITAKKIVNEFSEKQLSEIFFHYGEEKNSRKIAKSIVLEREKKEINTTLELSRIVKKINSYNKKNPSTRVFQALRIYVNNELYELDQFLKICIRFLNKNSRIIIVSFHSLEDRIVKNFFRENLGFLKIITKKPITPSYQEIKKNPRSRSAKMRVAQIIWNYLFYQLLFFQF